MSEFRENCGAPLGQSLEGKQKNYPDTTRMLRVRMLRRQQCNNGRVQRSTNNSMSHWALICLWCLLELHLHRMYQRQIHTAPAVVPVGETCLFASNKCLIVFSALFHWKGLLGNEYNDIWSGVKPRNLHKNMEGSGVKTPLQWLRVHKQWPAFVWRWGWFVRMLFGTSRTGLWCARKVNFQSTVRAHRLRTHIPEEMIEKGWPGKCTFMIRYKGTGSSTTDGSSLEKKTFPFIYLFICIYLKYSEWNLTAACTFNSFAQYVDRHVPL